MLLVGLVRHQRNRRDAHRRRESGRRLACRSGIIRVYFTEAFFQQPAYALADHHVGHQALFGPVDCALRG